MDFIEATDSEWHQLGIVDKVILKKLLLLLLHMQIVSTSLQTDNHASTPPLSFYRPVALPAA